MHSFTVHYINLTKRADRNEMFQRSNSGNLQLKRVEAVVGSDLKANDLIRDKLIHELLPNYSPGALGNAISHAKMWDLVINSGNGMTLAEDDAILNRTFARKASEVLERLPSGWDIILWGWNFDSFLHVEMIPGMPDGVMNFYPQIRGRVLDIQKLDYSVVPVRLLGASGTLCYSVSRMGAKRLKDLCFPLKNESALIQGMHRVTPVTTIDIVMNKHYPALQAFVCVPPLAYTENDKATSDIFQK